MALSSVPNKKSSFVMNRALFFLFFATSGCSGLELEINEPDPVLQDQDSFSYYNYTIEAYSDTASFVSSNDVLQRAYQMATMEWTPKNPVPMNGGGFYAKGRTVRGAPYSSVKEINTYLFQDVSYHTFMTAVHNPRSVLYTEDISKAPYHGLNCAPYYGSVCSSSVMYALGIDIPFYANQIINLSYMERLKEQVIDSLKICDVIWVSGHVQMIYDIEHRADSIYRIAMFESSGKSAHITDYTKEQFVRMWRNRRYTAYRYKRLKYSDETIDFRCFTPVTYNDDLCPSKGDRSVYRMTDTIRIDIFNQEYDKIVLNNDSTEVASGVVVADTYEYSNLLPGIYSVCLQKDEKKSESVSFEVIETDVSYSPADSEGNIKVCFHSSVKPEFVALCDLSGDSFYYPISSIDEEQGFIIVPRAEWSEYYCKVVFKGEFGRLINKPIRVY